MNREQIESVRSALRIGWHPRSVAEHGITDVLCDMALAYLDYARAEAAPQTAATAVICQMEGCCMLRKIKAEDIPDPSAPDLGGLVLPPAPWVPMTVEPQEAAPRAMTTDELNALAVYNAEVDRGLVHTESYQDLMAQLAQLQREFDRVSGEADKRS